MADTLKPEARSRNMAAIKSKDTTPEVYFRKKLFADGFRYRKNINSIYGHPDVYLPKYRTAVFINGCFWHRHRNCKYAYTPKSRMDFWNNKFSANVHRDREVYERLKADNIKCLVVWECTIRKMKKSAEYEKDIIIQAEDFMKDNDLYHEI